MTNTLCISQLNEFTLYRDDGLNFTTLLSFCTVLIHWKNISLKPTVSSAGQTILVHTKARSVALGNVTFSMGRTAGSLDTLSTSTEPPSCECVQKPCADVSTGRPHSACWLSATCLCLFHFQLWVRISSVVFFWVRTCGILVGCPAWHSLAFFFL